MRKCQERERVVQAGDEGCLCALMCVTLVSPVSPTETGCTPFVHRGCVTVTPYNIEKPDLSSVRADLSDEHLVQARVAVQFRVEGGGYLAALTGCDDVAADGGDGLATGH